MISVDPLIRQAISNDNRKYLVSAVITLANNQGTLTLTNDELWENGGFAQEEAVSEDGKFTALGATIIGSASLSIKNQDEEYSSYDFTNAKVAVNISIEGVNVSPFRVGTYTVDDAKYTEASINLTMLDNMEQFDRPYGTGVNTRMLTYPATLFQIVNAACLDCGVSLKGTSFPNSTFSVPNAFGTEGLTYREVVGMAAAIAGCYVKCTPTGLITLEWFNRTDLDSWRTAYSRSATIPSSVLNNMHYFTSLSSQEISVDPVVITGVNIVYEKEDESGKKQSYVEPYGTPGYIITIEKNEILNVCTLQQIQSVRDRLGAQLVGLTFRKVSISHLSDPTIEAGDIAAVWDRRDRGYPMLVTRTNFTPYSLQKSVSGAETPSRNSSTRYSWSTKNHIESQKKLNSEISTREMIEQRLRDAISGAAGLFFYKDETQNPPIYYLHNYSDFDSSPIRIMISTAGVMVTANGTDANPTWYGLTVDGTMVTNLLRTTGFSFDWATGGTLSLGGQDNIDGVLHVHDANGNLIGLWDKDGLEASGNLTITKTVKTPSGSSTPYTDVYNTGLGEFDYLEVDRGFSSTPTWTTKKGFYTHFYRNSSLVGQYCVVFDNYLKYATEQVIAKQNYYKNIIFPANGTTSGRYFTLNVSVGESGGQIYLWPRAYGSQTVSGMPFFNLGPSSLAIKSDYSDTTSPSNTTGAIFSINGGNTSIIRIIGGNADVYITDVNARINGLLLAYQSSSSIRYKHNIKQLSADRDAHKLLELPIVEFEWNDDHNLQYADMKGKVIPGIIAEDVAEIYPTAVIHDPETGEIESWDERRIIPGMLALIQEQHKKIEALEKKEEEQNRKIKDLEERLIRLEKTVNAFL